MRKANLTEDLRRHLTLAGLPEIRVHDLRHAHVALLIAAGEHSKAIQRRLGHTSIKTTLDRYGHLMPDAFQGIGERLEAVLDGNRKATAEGRVRTGAGIRAGTGS